jgi:hypothetical protein
MNHLRILRTLGALALILACAGPSVRYDYDAKGRFPAYHSYAWQGGLTGTGEFDNAIVSRRVEQAVEIELGAKGFTREAGPASPDFLLTFRTLPEPVQSQRIRLGLGIGLGPLGLGVNAPVGAPHRLAMAGILLEIHDFRSGESIWKATAGGALRSSDGPEEADSEVQQAVHRMFEHFPPQQP